METKTQELDERGEAFDAAVRRSFARSQIAAAQLVADVVSSPTLCDDIALHIAAHVGQVVAAAAPDTPEAKLAFLRAEAAKLAFDYVQPLVQDEVRSRVSDVMKVVHGKLLNETLSASLPILGLPEHVATNNSRSYLKRAKGLAVTKVEKWFPDLRGRRKGRGVIDGQLRSVLPDEQMRNLVVLRFVMSAAGHGKSGHACRCFATAAKARHNMNRRTLRSQDKLLLKLSGNEAAYIRALDEFEDREDVRALRRVADEALRFAAEN